MNAQIDLIPPIQTPITGREWNGKKETPYQSLVQFYNAFNNRNLELMQVNWANRPNISMANPLGGIMRGWNKLRSTYERIFSGQATVYVEYYDYTIHESDALFYAVGREQGYFQTGSEQVKLAIRTSRIFEKIEGEWKQVHHHGSIENPELLKTYQELVRK